MAIALALVPAWSAALEGATITGRGTSDAGAPLPSARLVREGLNIGTLSREDGTYSFTVPAARATGQQAQITARLIGFRSVTLPITLSPGTITRDFTLAANPLQLGEVVVTGAGTPTTREKLGNVIISVDSSLI